MTEQDRIWNEQETYLTDFFAAADRGQELIKGNDFLDMDAVDVMRLYKEFTAEEKPLLDAFANAVHKAYSAGIVRGLVTAARQEDMAK